MPCWNWRPVKGRRKHTYDTTRVREAQQARREREKIAAEKKGRCVIGYFSNGAEGGDYHSLYCDRCVHDTQNDCPIWNAHIMHNGKDEFAGLLDTLIPRSQDGLANEECRLFHLDQERARRAEADQKHLDWSASR